jgi:hypothetical protein
MDDCIVGGLTEEEARKATIAYFEDNYTLPHDVIYPNQEPPALEGRDEPFIVLSLIGVDKEQAGMGSRDYIIGKFLDISLWIREYTGIKEVTIFADFVNGLGLDTVGGIVYGVPEELPPKDHKGWSLNTRLLPLKF